MNEFDAELDSWGRVSQESERVTARLVAKRKGKSEQVVTTSGATQVMI